MKIVALFDFDGTIVKGDSFREFLKFNLKNNGGLIALFKLSWITFLRKLKIISLARAKEKAINCFYSGDDAKWKALVDGFANNVLSLLLLNDAINRINWHKTKGHLIVIVSSAPNIYFDSLKKTLGFDNVLASDIGYANGKAVLSFHCFGKDKVVKLKKVFKNDIDLSNSYAYSDHHSDIHLLKIVGNPIVVSPTKLLRAHAENNHWQILKWQG